MTWSSFRRPSVIRRPLTTTRADRAPAPFGRNWIVIAQVWPGESRFGQLDVCENIAASIPSRVTAGAPSGTALRLVTTTDRALLMPPLDCSPKDSAVGAISSAGATGTVTTDVSEPPPACVQSRRKVRVVLAPDPTSTPLVALPLTGCTPLQSPLAEQLVTPSLSHRKVTDSPDLTPVAGAVLLSANRVVRPVPASAEVRRIAGVSMTIDAERAPARSGEKRTVTAQLACTASDAPQLCVTGNCALSTPVAKIRLIVTAALPELVSVRVCGALVAPTLTVPRLTAVGLKATPFAVTRSLRTKTLIPPDEFLNAV